MPVVEHAIDPETFPRDAALIDAQGRLMITDEIIAAVARLTSLPLDAIFLAGYLLSVALFGIGLVLIGQRVYCHAMGRRGAPRRADAAPSHSTNQRQLVRAVLSSAHARLRRRVCWRWRRCSGAARGSASRSLQSAGLIHVTTGLWFSILIGVALVMLEPALRRLAVAGAAVVIAAGAWALTAGPLRASMTQMDAVWLQAVASKDSLFASQWPLWAWLANLGAARGAVVGPPSPPSFGPARPPKMPR